MIIAILISLGLAAGAGGEETSPISTPTAIPSPALTIGVVEPVRFRSGEAATIAIPVRVADGHRVQANPASNEFLVPLQMEIEDVDGLVFGPPVYPKSEPYRLQGAEEPLRTYVGAFEIVIPVRATKAAVPGDHIVSGELHFQACNSRMCLFPSAETVEILVVITETTAPDTLQSGQ